MVLWGRGEGEGDLFRRVIVAFVLVRYWGIEEGSLERDLEGGEEDEPIVMGAAVMGLQRSGGEQLWRRGPRLRLGRSWHLFSRRDHLSTVYTPQPHSPIGLMPKAP